MTAEETEAKWVDLVIRLGRMDYELMEAICTDEEALPVFKGILKEMISLGGSFESLAREFCIERNVDII